MHWGRPVKIFLAALALAAVAVGPALAAPGDAAYVDLKKVLEEYKKTTAFAKYQTRLREQARGFGAEMETLTQFRYCTEGERQEALALKAKPRRSKAEDARLEELSKKADRVENELSTLSQKPNPTETDTKRIQELSKMRSDAIKNLAKEHSDRQEKLRKIETGLYEELENELLKYVQQVARDEKLPVIYERRAVLSGGLDLTQQVVKKLPK